MGSAYGGVPKFLLIVCLRWNLASSKVYKICILATTKETMWMSSTIIIVGSSIVEDGLEMQRDIVDNFKQHQALSFSYP
jgi:hypothetical protein